MGGTIVNQLICHGGCNAVRPPRPRRYACSRDCARRPPQPPRERSEDFLTVSLEIKTQASLIDSLNAYTAGERLADVACPTCNKWGPAAKHAKGLGCALNTAAQES